MEMQRMRPHLHNAHQHQRCDLSELHQTEKGQTAMDAIRHNAIIIGCIIGFTATAFTACAQVKPQPPAQETAAVEFVYADQYGPPGQAVAELAGFLSTITTTSTTVPKPPQNGSTSITETANPIDHADMWDTLAMCESGGNWSYPPVSGGFSGGLMFHIGTWRAMGGTEYAPDAWQATREQQIDIAERTKAAAGGSMSPWPGCARKHGWL